MRVGVETKGLRVSVSVDAGVVLDDSPGVDSAGFSWPLLTLDAAAIDHNIAAMAAASAEHGVTHAPHVKTHMSPELFARQAAAGAWGATVANPSQLRAVRAWGVDRIFLANQLVDPRDIAWLRSELADDTGFEVLVYVDSVRGVELLAEGFSGADDDVRSRLGLLVEVGVDGGRTGTRSLDGTLTVARAVRDAGLRLTGISGYEGSVGKGFDAASLAAVEQFCESLRTAATALLNEDLVGPGPVVVSAGGSAYLDVVLPALAGSLTAPDGSSREVLPIVRAGAYIIHDHGLLLRADPWARMEPPRSLRAAATVWAQVLSVPEDGLALCGAGRRDVPYDIDLPTPVSVRKLGTNGQLGQPTPLSGLVVTKVDDQHLYLRRSTEDDVDGPGLAGLEPGDVVGLGISHPCTLFDKWRNPLLTDAQGNALELVHTEF